MSIETDHTMLGYARASTLEQDEAFRVDALRVAGCGRVFVNKASGKLEHRLQLDALLDQLRPGDTVVVWRLDRLGRSLRHLIDTVRDLDSRGVAFRSLTENIDTSTPGGRLISHVFGALAELERDLIRERTMGWPLRRTGSWAPRPLGGAPVELRPASAESAGLQRVSRSIPPSCRLCGGAGPGETVLGMQTRAPPPVEETAPAVCDPMRVSAASAGP